MKKQEQLQFWTQQQFLLFVAARLEEEKPLPKNTKKRKAESEGSGPAGRKSKPLVASNGSQQQDEEA